MSRTPPSDQEWKKEGSAFSAQMLEQRRRNVWVNFVSGLKRQAPIRINTDTLGESSENSPT
jgi:hypothetical protein